MELVAAGERMALWLLAHESVRHRARVKDALDPNR